MVKEHKPNYLGPNYLGSNYLRSNFLGSICLGSNDIQAKRQLTQAWGPSSTAANVGRVLK